MPRGYSHLFKVIWPKSGPSSGFYRQKCENFGVSVAPRHEAVPHEKRLSGLDDVYALVFIDLENGLVLRLSTSGLSHASSPSERASGKFAESSRKWLSRTTQAGSCAKVELETLVWIVATCRKKNYGNRTPLACARPENVVLARFSILAKTRGPSSRGRSRGLLVGAF